MNQSSVHLALILIPPDPAEGLGTSTMLDYRNCGDTAGAQREVAGPPNVVLPVAQIPAYTPPERQYLLALARSSITAAVLGGQGLKVDPDGLPARLTRPKGCFVTLTRSGSLRGCIGHIFPKQPLYQAVLENARCAALLDPRFEPVRSHEVTQVQVEISVLTEPEPLPFGSPEELLQRLQPYRHGVVLRLDGVTTTFLPQVWEKLPDKVNFLDNLALKAGCPPAAWRDSQARLEVYQAEVFHE